MFTPATTRKGNTGTTIPVRFAPQVFFHVGVLAGSTSGRPARQLTNNHISAPVVGQRSSRWPPFHRQERNNQRAIELANA
jgi:hypothetical protein